MTAKQRLDDAIETHTTVVRQFQEARITVAGWETISVLTPGEVDRLEARLADLYRVIQEQSEGLAKLASELEFNGEDGINNDNQDGS